MEIRVVIPTYQRPAKIGACLRALARQTLDPAQYEVLVGFDGPDLTGAAGAADVWREAGGAPGSLRAVQCPREGLNATRNRVIADARGRFLLSVNDDVIADPRLLEVHASEQRAGAARGQPVIISGYSPWRVFENDTLFDRLVRETSMLFFYDRMLTGPESRDPMHDWGFRHCWGLNFSAPLGALREVGAFTSFPLAYGYDDIEIAFRLKARFGMPVLFRPTAVAEHDHRYTPREVLDRERKLGASAWHFAAHHPEFCRAVFNRDIRSTDEIAYSRAFVDRERGAAERLERSFLSLAGVPASAVQGGHAPALVNLIYEQHLLLKRWTWRKGLLESAGAS